MRVVSLVPSISETLRAWGVEPVATTSFCEPVGDCTVGGTKNPDVDRIVSLEPDVVVMDTHENRVEDHRALVGHGVRVVVTAVESLEGLAAQLSTVAEALEVDVDADIEVPAAWPIRRRAFVPIWRRPWMTIGGKTYGSTVLAHLGIGNIFVDRDGYPEVGLDEVADRSPDLVIVPSEPYTFRPHHLGELAALAPVIEVDGQDLFWWGARTVPAMRRLETVLHPDGSDGHDAAPTQPG